MASLFIIRGFFERKCFIYRRFLENKAAQDLQDLAELSKIFAYDESIATIAKMQIPFNTCALTDCGKTL
jgi:hypothetical protein